MVSIKKKTSSKAIRQTRMKDKSKRAVRNVAKTGSAFILFLSSKILFTRKPVQVPLASLLSRGNSQNLWRALKHMWGNESRCDLVKDYAIDERQGYGNTPHPLRLKDKGQTES